jgi:hypothetical protein
MQTGPVLTSAAFGELQWSWTRFSSHVAQSSAKLQHVWLSVQLSTSNRASYVEESYFAAPGFWYQVEMRQVSGPWPSFEYGAPACLYNTIR